ncbi:MAG: hypothetical protein NVS2B17_34440 [Candidatus Velthaea sp.]
MTPGDPCPECGCQKAVHRALGQGCGGFGGFCGCPATYGYPPAATARPAPSCAQCAAVLALCDADFRLEEPAGAIATDEIRNILEPHNRPAIHGGT